MLTEKRTVRVPLSRDLTNGRICVPTLRGALRLRRRLSFDRLVCRLWISRGCEVQGVDADWQRETTMLMLHLCYLPLCGLAPGSRVRLAEC